MRKLARYEGEFWFIDLTGDNWVVDIVALDGTRRPATNKDGPFMDVLMYGPCVASPPANPSPGWFINFFKTYSP